MNFSILHSLVLLTLLINPVLIIFGPLLRQARALAVPVDGKILLTIDNSASIDSAEWNLLMFDEAEVLAEHINTQRASLEVQYGGTFSAFATGVEVAAEDNILSDYNGELTIPVGERVTDDLNPYEGNAVALYDVTGPSASLLQMLSMNAYEQKRQGHLGGFDPVWDQPALVALAVPEPTTLGLFGLGLLVIAGRRRRA